MALPDGDNLGHRLIQDELANSSMTTDKSSLRNMFYYVFGDYTTNMRRFANLGKPVMQTHSLSGSALEGGIALTFTVSNYGGFTPCRIYANYWKTGGQQNFKQIGEVQSDGTYTMDLTQLDGGTEYNVRVFAENKFNNAGNYPEHPNEGHFSFAYDSSTGTKDPITITTNSVDPQKPATPTWVRTWWISGNDFGTEWTNTNENDFEVEFRRVTPTNTYVHAPQAPETTSNWNGDDTVTKASTWDVSNMTVPNQDDYVQVRVRAYDSGNNVYSDWSQWVSAGYCAPQDITITSDSNRDVTATWNDPSIYSQTESLSNSINPVIQWFENDNWETRIHLANGATTASKDYSGSGVAKCRVTYNTDKGDTSQMFESNAITFDEPYNLGFREESNNTLYATWDNENNTEPIELEVEQNGSWGNPQTLTAGTTEYLIGGNIPSGYEFRFRVRYQGSDVWVTSSLYTI